MIDPNNPDVDVDRLMERVRDEVVHGTYVYASELDTTAVEALLQTARQMTQVRTKWPRRFWVFPFSVSAGLRRFALRLLAFLFNDQRNVNMALIAAVNETLQVNRELHRIISVLQGELRQFEDRLRSIEGPHGGE